MPVDSRGTGLVEEHVRQGVREVARDRHEPVVRTRVDCNRPCAERGDEAVHRAQQLRAGAGGRRQEPRRAVEELGVGALGAAGLGAADRVTADEAGVTGGGGADRALRRPDVRDDALGSARARSTSRTACGSSATGAATTTRSDPATASARRPGGLHGLPLVRDAEDVRVGIPPSHARPPRAARRARRTRRSDPSRRRRRCASRSATPASARRPGTPGRATGGRSGAGRRAIRTWCRAAPRARLRSRPRHSVTFSPVISRWTPPGQVPTSRWAAKKPSISRRMSSSRRVLWPEPVTKPFACIGSHTQTTGTSASRTARSSGGSSSCTRLAPRRVMSVSRPGDPVRVQSLDERDELVRASSTGRPSRRPD